MTLAGGTRARCVRTSVFNAVKDGLTSIGWFTAGRNHQPVTLIQDKPDFASDITVALNTCALFAGDSVSHELEMGAYSVAEHWDMMVEIYAESDQVGIALAKDIQRLLQGAYPGISDTPAILLTDYTQNPTVNIGYLEVEDVKFKHPEGTQVYQQSWFRVEFTIIDYDYAA